MKPARCLFVALLLTALAGAAFAQNNRGPYMGYLYPAGAQRGATVDVTIGGRYLMGSGAVYVTGDGIRAVVLEHVRQLSPQQIGDIVKHIGALLKQRAAELAGRAKPAAAANAAKAAEKSNLPPLPDHPWLRNLDKLTIPELEYLGKRLADRRRQPTPQIAEMVIIRVSIDPNATPGDRELRLATPAGLTNPMIFQVGQLPEVAEREPNDGLPLPGMAASATPVVLNGQISPGDVDRFRIQAKRGQKLVVKAEARHLIPYLADAVPGWFQAVLALYDATGREVAYADDYRFDPDPVILYQVPQDGEYTVEIRDSIYRGRDDFVYRISVGELPFITSMYPLGGREGTQTLATVAGWNLPWTQVVLDTQPGAGFLRQASWRTTQWLSNSLPYAVDTLPETYENEPNDTIATAQRLTLPVIINGRVSRPGDVDVFSFDGRADDDVVAEVYARRLNSPLDSLVRITDAAGKVLAWNDDSEDKATGLITHHADSYVSFKLPATGTYYVHLYDTQRHGGDDYAYRLRIGPKQPSFALRVTPSSLTIPAGRTATLTAYVVRRDGFQGPVELFLGNGATSFRLSGAVIPADKDQVTMTLTAPPQGLQQPIPLLLEARAQIGAATITRSVIAAENMMQAFAYQHLVPSQLLLCAVTGGRRNAPNVQIASALPVRIPAGGTAQISVQVGAAAKQQGLQLVKLELSDPPKGITLENVLVVPGGLALMVKSDAAAVKVGDKNNLLVEAFVEFQGTPPKGVQQPKGKPAQKGSQRFSIGFLPAIPYQIVK